MKPRYIAVEGPIGVGKTSLVERLTPRFEAVKVLEDVENPFLDDFYRDRPGAAFRTQLFFLLQRVDQQQALVQRELFEQVTIADYMLAKDKLFAHLTLDDAELSIYNKLYALLAARLPVPDLVLYLSATTDVLMERIRRRGRDAEERLARSYVDEVNQAYNYFFYHYRDSPLLVVDTSHIDFVHSLGDLNDLVQQIERMERGVEYYVPCGS